MSIASKACNSSDLGKGWQWFASIQTQTRECLLDQSSQTLSLSCRSIGWQNPHLSYTLCNDSFLLLFVFSYPLSFLFVHATGLWLRCRVRMSRRKPKSILRPPPLRGGTRRDVYSVLIRMIIPRPSPSVVTLMGLKSLCVSISKLIRLFEAASPPIAFHKFSNSFASSDTFRLFL